MLLAPSALLSRSILFAVVKPLRPAWSIPVPGGVMWLLAKPVANGNMPLRY